MPTRPDLRDITSNVREAFSEMDREALLEILTFVVKEYVVEGPPPMLVHQAETLADLKAPSFAQLVTALQTRFDHPELAMFVVDGDQVSVRVGGVVQPLLASRQPLAELPRPAAGVRVVEQASPVRPPAPAAAPPAAPAAVAPPPVRGISLRGRPTGGGGEPASPAPPAPAAPPAAAPNDKPESTGGDDASARFSLLELD